MINHLLRRVLTALAATLVAAYAAAYTPLPQEFCGSMMPYDFAKCDPAPQFPDSLRPVAVSYIARHGSRYLSSEKKIQKLRKVLRKAEADSRISTKGKAFLALLDSIASVSNGRWGALSSVGIAEEEKLGVDMAEFFPALTDSGKVICMSTYMPRVIMTMYQFLHSMEWNRQNLEIHTCSGHQNDSLLFCFGFDHAYEAYRDSGNWTPVYEKFVSERISPAPAVALFDKGYVSDRHKLQDLTLGMYGVIQSLSAFGFGWPDDEWMSARDFHDCWLASNAKHYFRNNVTPLSDVCISATAPLVRRIIADAEDALQSGSDTMIHGYFGHAETLLPLLSVMQLPGCCASTTDPEKLAEVWRLQDITPLGANLMIIFLKSESGRIYSAMRLNGRNICPLPDADIVPWSVLRGFWLSRIN